jgi:hypothetical protein
MPSLPLSPPPPPPPPPSPLSPLSPPPLSLSVQIWLAINNLVVDPKARAKYPMDDWRKEKLMGLKR